MVRSMAGGTGFCADGEWMMVWWGCIRGSARVAARILGSLSGVGSGGRRLCPLAQVDDMPLLNERQTRFSRCRTAVSSKGKLALFLQHKLTITRHPWISVGGQIHRSGTQLSERSLLPRGQQTSAVTVHSTKNHRNLEADQPLGSAAASAKKDANLLST